VFSLLFYGEIKMCVCYRTLQTYRYARHYGAICTCVCNPSSPRCKILLSRKSES